jgi:hypothetical protein
MQTSLIRSRKFFVLLAIALASIVISPSSGRAQVNASLTSDAQKERINELEVDRKTLELENEILRKSLPGISTRKVLEGGTTITTGKDKPTTFESKILAHQSLKKVVEELSSELKAVKDLSSIVVFEGASTDNNVVNSIETYQRYAYFYQNLKSAYDKESGRESLNFTALEIPAALLGSLTDSLALFRTDTQINQSDLMLPEEAIVAQLAQQFSKDTSRPIKLLYPKMYAQNFGILKGEFSALLKSKQDAAQKNPGSVAKLDGQYNELLAYMKDNLTNISRGAAAARTLQGAGSYVLVLTTAGGGGDRTTKNLVFGTRTRYSGGAILHYLLFDTASGKIAASNTIYYHTGYVRIKPNEPITNISQ